MSFDQKTSMNVIKYPFITEKTINLIEQNQYSFAVDAHATKIAVKIAIEFLFDVKVISINTYLQAPKKRRVGKSMGKKSQYKRAIVTLAPDNFITLYEDV